MTHLETPSGKGAGDENFPVGSWLLPASVRPHVMAFYAFVRAADDIADNPELDGADKLDRLERFEAALLGDERASIDLPKARTLRRSLATTGVSERHALDLLNAFKQDATKQRYQTWSDLLDYCACSASPVGRFLLDLHGEDPALYRFSDPLCDALQVLNHLQDCGDDYRKLDRVYLPLESFRSVGLEVDALNEPAASPGMRQVFDHALAGTDRLLESAADLPKMLISRRLGAESAVILEIARRLSLELQRHDPIKGRVELSKGSSALTALKGLGRLHWLRSGPGRRSGATSEVMR